MSNHPTSKIFFAIRDDDIDFWTDSDQLEELYAPLWDKGVIVSFSAIPFGVETHGRGDWDSFYQVEGTERPIGDNKELISYLREKIAQGKIEIMLHGYNHLYKVRESWSSPTVIANQKNLHGLRTRKQGAELQWIPECIWKAEGQLKEDLVKGKKYLESLFSVPIKVFVPPSNSIGSVGARVLDVLHLNLSGTIARKKDRDWSYDYAWAYFKRTLFFLRHKGALYPFPLQMKLHQELAAHSLTPTVSFDVLKQSFELCCQLRAPFVLATHWWEIEKQSAMRETFYNVVDYILKKNAYSIQLSALFK